MGISGLAPYYLIDTDAGDNYSIDEDSLNLYGLGGTPTPHSQDTHTPCKNLTSIELRGEMQVYTRKFLPDHLE